MANTSAIFEISPNENKIINVGGLSSIASDKVVLVQGEKKQTLPQTGEVTNLYSMGGGLFFIILFILLLKKKRVLIKAGN